MDESWRGVRGGEGSAKVVRRWESAKVGKREDRSLGGIKKRKWARKNFANTSNDG